MLNIKPKRDKSKLSALEKLRISREKKDDLYKKFDLKLLAYAAKYYFNQKIEPKDMGQFIEEICLRCLEKRKLKASIEMQKTKNSN